MAEPDGLWFRCPTCHRTTRVVESSAGRDYHGHVVPPRCNVVSWERFSFHPEGGSYMEPITLDQRGTL
jgi:hypothetical protein